MQSTTGRKIRSDRAGDGHWRARRGSRRHKGVDDLCRPGQIVVAPIAGCVIRKAYPYADKSYGGILIRNTNMEVKIFYFQPDPWIIGQAVKQGERIGIAQDITERYPGQGMQPHIHREVTSINPLFLEEE